ncbi:MAG: hypothetical protein A3J55_04150 [Candidatus Ryanbacteria bacterium RIFCSPHIGHO2_02_FULL_45_17b]|uniref:GMP synthase (glutamine-hydrolyzing) n=1 Tax=Candidatus Ryanbacteria bacterium RIFCSPHIGHO2_01_FULL_45_22 TaxID=1802114 RepID=A0A1G2G2U7_9BACT|nr:MAG: hypothetical protein A2719_02285 [Candidatus Ryanbacteria bacterium RIFCSPHIGHO2_01_FULL_45_22]OGZ46500.1 MAG: hypothetical protein A3J55_04150 [Candidatus Ryanbacteria bacterium RIFCSPHIGHO2_02_FULL_45_17b]
MLEGSQVLIVDFGSQLTQVIQRAIRELGVRSTIHKPDGVEHWLSESKPQCIIFSGGPASVYDAGALKPPGIVYEMGVPILGICYGMQVLAEHFGGRVESAGGNRDYGRAHVTFFREMVGGNDRSYEGETVFASHGDSVCELPVGFKKAAVFPHGGLAAMVDPVRRIWGVQYHPEAMHTVYGKQFLMRFLFETAKCKQDISQDEIYIYTQDHVKSLVEGRNVLVGYSGGVDSSVAVALVKQSAKSIVGVCIDTGGLREGELEEIKRNADSIGLSLKIVDTADVFLDALSGLEDAEEKRLAFANMYKQLFLREEQQRGADCVVKGSIGPDFIETKEAGALIKTHHNIDSYYIHPLRGLFKHEVREIGRRLGLPSKITERQPFPGPGLFIRILGPITRERMQLVRWADARVREVLRKNQLWDKISQTVVALFVVPTVGVKGDNRVYTNSIIVRAVSTPDFMTAEPYPVPLEVWREAESALTRHPDIVRMFIDVTSKPPATIEFQ